MTCMAEHQPLEEGVIVWKPDPQVRQRARLTAFLEQCGLESFEELQARSVEDVGWFTEEVLRFLEIEFEPPYERVLDLSRGPEWPDWCVGGGLNASYLCLDRHIPVRGAQPALVWEGEAGETRTMTYEELARSVEECAAGLRTLGLGKGDAVGLHLPMIPETSIALLACARIGAIAVPLFSGFGTDAIEGRLRDVEAKALFTFDAFLRRGKPVPGKPVADRACAELPGLLHMIVVARTGTAVPMRPGRDRTWDELLAAGRDADASYRTPEPTGAEDPLMVIYSSGTTGKPKGIVHTHCGFPIKAAQDMAFGTDVGPGTRILWITDIGWMMGPWLIYGGLLLGGTVVLYEGAPDHPEPDRLWSLCERHEVEVLGVSPTLIRVLMARGEAAEPQRAPPGSLRIFASTGEPWNPTSWQWLFERVGGGHLPIINYTGGTEIGGGILMGNPLLPVKPCSFPAPCPGIDADVVGEDGERLREGVGELVIRQPWIGMARGFWRNPDRYLESYWSRWPGVWVHGDWARIDADGHWFVPGRSDDTLNVAGQRIGPAEVESALVADPSVLEAAVIGVPDPRLGTAMIGFCVPTGPPSDRDAWAESLRERVGVALGKPMRPKRIVLVPALPKTRSAKVMRRVIRAAWLGEDAGDLSALENPEAADAIAEAAKAVRAAAQSEPRTPESG